ncbi:MAG: agmatine deiminase family protein [Tannerella sp.]|jgi:agmatine/peptidylarginine deiminase|nr:agmatine deiminase family protein [Tannerella sp.]
MTNSSTVFPAEWHPQSAVQLTWPHEDTDWRAQLDEVVPCFVAIAREVMRRETALIVCADEREVRTQLGTFDERRAVFRQISTNDTWARDHGGITVLRDGVPEIRDFVFNGWGMKYPACHDNRITGELFKMKTFAPFVKRCDMSPFVLEGGSVESDGRGTLLTTSKCLLSHNRNTHLDRAQVEAALKSFFGAGRVLWLEHGHLAGDDTDGHVDTLARFCDAETIAYVQCTDEADRHFRELHAMEATLRTFRTTGGKPYRLIPLPMADPAFDDGGQLPATYANFLIINGAVLAPFYGSPKDRMAQSILQQTFPGREIVGIDCTALIRQHGSLHCVTMQYPVEAAIRPTGHK